MLLTAVTVSPGLSPAAEAGEPGDVLVAQQLRVLDGAPAADRLERVEHSGVRPVADRVDRRSQPALVRAAHERHELVVQDRGEAERMLEALEPGVRIEAPRGAGVQRAVGDRLGAADGHEAAGARQRVAGAQALGDGPVEVLRVDAERDENRRHREQPGQWMLRAQQVPQAGARRPPSAGGSSHGDLSPLRQLNAPAGSG